MKCVDVLFPLDSLHTVHSFGLVFEIVVILLKNEICLHSTLFLYRGQVISFHSVAYVGIWSLSFFPPA